jgi:AcrR family transcriptional regulator
MDKKKKEANTEEKILLAAKKVFVVKGLAGARMQDIADEAGMNKALLHYYFRSKDKLFEMIFKEATKNFIPRISAIFQSDLSLFDKIESFCSEYIQKVMENPFIPLFILNEINKQPYSFLKKMFGAQKPEIQKFVQQLKEEEKKGIIVSTDPMQLLMSMMSMCVFPFVAKPLWQFIGGITDEQFISLMKARKELVPKFIITSIMK